jgi:hypothetical protein
MAIRVRVIDQTPRLYIVDKLDEAGIKHPCELLTLTPDELRDARAALEAAETAPPRAYVVGQDGRAVVDV